MKKNELPKGITQEMITTAKETHGDNAVKLAELPMNEDKTEFLTVLICRPNRTTITEYQKFMDKQPGKADSILINRCLLSHKDEVLGNDFLYYAAVNAISQILPIGQATVKNI